MRATVTLAAAAAAGTTRGAPLVLATAVWPTSVVFARKLPSAFFLVARPSFVAITTAFTIPVAVTAVWAFPITVRIAVTVVSVSPATVPVPVPIPTITVVTMVLARGAVTFRVTVVVMMMRAVCKRERRKEVSTVLEVCLLVEGAPVDW